MQLAEDGHQIVLTTCASETDARMIGQALVADGLAPCVNVVPGIQTIYLLRGKPESATECLLLVRADASNYGAIEARICELHPYELPEVVAVPIVAGLDRFLDWITRPE